MKVMRKYIGGVGVYWALNSTCTNETSAGCSVNCIHAHNL